jgi:hypothetical protein
MHRYQLSVTLPNIFSKCLVSICFKKCLADRTIISDRKLKLVTATDASIKNVTPSGLRKDNVPNPQWSRYGLDPLNADPDPGSQINPDPCQALYVTQNLNQKITLCR